MHVHIAKIHFHTLCSSLCWVCMASQLTRGSRLGPVPLRDPCPQAHRHMTPRNRSGPSQNPSLNWRVKCRYVSWWRAIYCLLICAFTDIKPKSLNNDPPISTNAKISRVILSRMYFVIQSSIYHQLKCIYSSVLVCDVI